MMNKIFKIPKLYERKRFFSKHSLETRIHLSRKLEIPKFELINPNSKESKLPFIIFPENNLKVLIETGSTKSFIKPEIAQQYFKNSIKKDPFKIFTAHGTSFENFSTTIHVQKCLKKISHLTFICLTFITNLIAFWA